MTFGLGLSFGNHRLPGTADVAPITPVTSGMSVTATWLVTDGSQTTLASSTEASIKIEASVSPSDTGILLEQGGSGSGLVIYVYDGVLYAQLGTGSGAGPNSSRAFLQHPLSETLQLIEVSASVVHGRGALYADGVLVETDTFNTSTLAGGDTGGLGRVYNSEAANFGGWTTDGSGAFTGTIEKADIFLNQVTADVAL